MAEIDHADFVAALGDVDDSGCILPRGLPDGEIVGSTSEQWQALLDTLNASPWDVVLREHEHDPFPTRDEHLPEYWHIGVQVTPGILVNFFDWGIIGFDINLEEIVSQAELDTFLAFMRDLARGVGRDINLRPEGMDPTADANVVIYHLESDSFEYRRPKWLD